MEKSEKLIVSAVEQGVNYFDTAYIYGGSEQALGEILHRNRLRDKVNIATKLPPQQCKRYEDYDRIFNDQKQRLKTDYVDFYLIHNLSTLEAWKAQRALGIDRWLKEKKEQGQIKRVGFSFHGAKQVFADLLDEYDWDFVQIQYNYINENYQAGRSGLEKACAKGLPVIVMEPLLGGKLANGLPKAAAQLFTEADAALTHAAWAMRWLYDQREVTVVLSGMNGEEQLSDNVKTAANAAPGMLTEKERAVYQKALSVFEESYKIPCTGCNYCMPCPSGVNIPACFTAYNTSYSVGYLTGIIQHLTNIGMNNPQKVVGAHKCVKCGKCEKQCPQHIAVVKEMEAVQKHMEPFWLRGALRLYMALSGGKKKP
jgi:predicted aldo/keto reductase-like oxidoreductase